MTIDAARSDDGGSWHRNHRAFPAGAAGRWELSGSGAVIWALEKLGLAGGPGAD